jgi:large subunit ribosomal protein L18
MAKPRSRERRRMKRHRRVRARVQGTAERPRLSVFRSLRHIYAQVIDDTAGRTMLSASTLDPEVREQLGESSKAEQGKLVGELLAKRALQVGIKQVVFDRGGYKYHGRVKAVAEAARAGGLEF